MDTRDSPITHDGEFVRSEVVESLFNAWAFGQVWTPSKLGSADNTALQSLNPKISIASNLGLLPSQTGKYAEAPADLPISSQRQPTITAAEIRTALLRYQNAMRPDQTIETEAGFRIAAEGAQLQGTSIIGCLDISFIKFSPPIKFINCRFELPLILDGAELGYVSLEKSSFPWLSADGTTFHADFDLTEVRALAGNIRGARIVGRFGLTGALLALELLRQLEDEILPLATGSTRQEFSFLPTIRRPDLSGDFLSDEYLQSLANERVVQWVLLQENGGVERLKQLLNVLNGAAGTTKIAFSDAAIRRHISKNLGVRSTDERFVHLKDSLTQWCRTAASALSAISDVIQPSLSGWMTDGTKKAPLDALTADAVDVGASVFLDSGFHAIGRVSFVRAHIGGRIACWKGYFDNIGGTSFDGESITTDDSVFLTAGFRAVGQISFEHGRISGHIDCSNSRITSVGKLALDCQNAVVDSSVKLGPDCFIDGRVSFRGARVAGTFRLGPRAFCDRLVLAHAGVDVFDLEPDSLPHHGCLWLDGFTYRRLGESSQGATYGLAILNRQSTSAVSTSLLPQPYLQLASVLAATGHQGEATEVLREFADRKLFLRDSWLWLFSPIWWLLYYVFVILAQLIVRVTISLISLWGRYWLAAKRSEREDFARRAREEYGRFNVGLDGIRAYMPAVPLLGFVYWPIRFLLWLVAGHGYTPFRAVIWLAAVYFVGVTIFSAAYDRGMMRPTPDITANIVPGGAANGAEKIRNYDIPFNAWIFSLDVLTPVVELGQKKYWMPISMENRLPESAPLRSVGHFKIIDAIGRSATDAGVNMGNVGWFERLRSQLIPAIDAGLAEDWYWAEIILGWALTTIAVAGYVGLIRPEGTPKA